MKGKLTKAEEGSLPAVYLIENASKVWVYRNACAHLRSNFLVSLEYDEIDADSLKHVGK